MTPDLDTRLNAQELARQLAEKRVSVIDVREAMEFAGGTSKAASMCRWLDSAGPRCRKEPWCWYATAVAAVPRL